MFTFFEKTPFYYLAGKKDNKKESFYGTIKFKIDTERQWLY